MEYHHKDLPAAKKFKTAPSVGKVVFTISLGINSAVHSEFMSAGATINYVTLQELNACIQIVRPDM